MKGSNFGTHCKKTSPILFTTGFSFCLAESASANLELTARTSKTLPNTVRTNFSRLCSGMGEGALGFPALKGLIPKSVVVRNIVKEFLGVECTSEKQSKISIGSLDNVRDEVNSF